MSKLGIITAILGVGLECAIHNWHAALWAAATAIWCVTLTLRDAR